jgi:hypothetical protein
MEYYFKRLPFEAFESEVFEFKVAVDEFSDVIGCIDIDGDFVGDDEG